MHKNTLVVGLLRGDEGKGKIVDYLSNYHSTVVRYAGGPNAGHSIYRNNKLFVTHIIPSGIFEKRTCIIGRGCVVNLDKLFKEYNDLCSFLRENCPEYLNPEKEIIYHLKLSYGANIITDKHIEEDTNKENSGHGNGSTKQGISPAYRDKYYREGIRVWDYLHDDKNRLDAKYGFIKSIAIDETHLINSNPNESYLFEGAQGILLDIDNPYYPNVSSSSVNVGGILTGTGISYKTLMRDFSVVGVVKSYMSSVGVGKFLTEMTSDSEEYTIDGGKVTYKFPAKYLREAGHEYGATTGRPRKVGWMDIPLLNYSIITTGVDKLCLTRVDTLREAFKDYEYIPICTGYKSTKTGNLLKIADIWNLDEYIPVYEFIKLWKSEDRNDKDFVNFIKFIESHTDTEVGYVSIGQNKNDIIERVFL